VVSRKDEGKGVGGNLFDSNNIRLNRDKGGITLAATIANGEAKAAQVISKTRFPLKGTFASKIKYIGPSVIPEAGMHSVKAFFTYTADKWKPDSQIKAPCIHVEHDFEVLSEEKHPWVPDILENVYAFLKGGFPLLQICVHEKDESAAKCYNLKRKKRPPAIPYLFSLKKSRDQFLTLVLTVDVKTLNEDQKLLSNFYVLDESNNIIWQKYIESFHDSKVKNLQIGYNVWWIDPNRSNVISSQIPQKMNVKWFYFNPDIINPAEAKNRGERLYNQ